MFKYENERQFMRCASARQDAYDRIKYDVWVGETNTPEQHKKYTVYNRDRKVQIAELLRIYAFEVMPRNVRRANDEIRDNVGFSDLVESYIEANPENDVLYMWTWGRDCDLCEASSISTLPVSGYALKQAVNRLYDNAEGPVSWKLITKREADEFEPTHRDRAAEMAGY